MANIWDVDVEIDAERCARLIGEQFPQLSPVRLELLGVGWDNAAYRVNDRLVFRFPRRQLGATLLATECRVLPRLAQHISVAVTAPTFLGEPRDGYPYPFAGYPVIEGVTACRVSWMEEERAALAPELGAFLKALHGIPVDDAALAEGPGDMLDRVNLPKGAELTLERFRGLLAGAELDQVCDLVQQLSRTPPHTGRPCWIHGDLYPRHLVIDENKRLAGVIDWGDCHLGDPALDLSIAWTFLPAAARPVFRAAYGPIDADAWNRARFRALFYAAALIQYGQSMDDAAMLGAGEYALHSALADRQS